MKITASSPITSWQIDGETTQTVTDFIFIGSKITTGGDCSHETTRHLLLGIKAMTHLDSTLKSRDITLLTKVHLVKAMVFPVVMYGCELDHKESWVIKNCCFWTVVLKTLKILLDCKKIKPVNSKGNQAWMFIGRTDAEAETPILWPPDVKNWLIRKDPDAGKDWRQEKGTTENEMVGWYHWHDGHAFEQAPGVGDGQGGLACCSPWGCKESDTTEWLNWTAFVFNGIVYSIKFANYIYYLLCISKISNRHTFDYVCIYICFPESWLFKHLPAHCGLSQEQKQVEQLLCLLSYRSTPLSQPFSLPFPSQEVTQWIVQEHKSKANEIFPKMQSS